jgi:hypothetical protein
LLASVLALITAISPAAGAQTTRTRQLEQRRADRAREVKSEARTKLEKTLLYLDLDEHCDCCTE